MKRSSSWKSLQKTFASTPEIPDKTKRPKCTRPKVNKQSVNKENFSESIDIQIEDSDEENGPNGTTATVAATTAKATATSSATKKPTPTQFHRNKRLRRMPKPLLINTSLNTTIANDSVVATTVCNSESDESVCGEPELRDVSELNKSDERRYKVRSKSLLFLDIKVPTNSANRTNSRITSPDVSSPAQQKKHTGKSCATTKQHDPQKATGVGSNDDDDDDDDDGDAVGTGTTIDTNSSSSEMDTPKKRTASKSDGLKKVRMTRTPTDIVFTQTNSGTSTNPVIESESSQFSMRFIESPTVPLRRSRRQKSRKHVKGGLVEQLNKAIGRTKSEYSFWMSERTTHLVEAGSKMHIDKMVCSYGRTLLYCTPIGTATTAAAAADEAAEEEAPGTNDGANKIVEILCVGPTFKKLHTLQVGKIIEIDFSCHGYMITDHSTLYPHVSNILV